MDRLLARLERRLGKFAIERLITFIVGGMAIVYVLSLGAPHYQTLLTLDISKVRSGQVWRLFTDLFLPTAHSPFWFLISLDFTYLVGSSLENEWGAFKFNVFYLMGMVGTTIAAFATHGAQGNDFSICRCSWRLPRSSRTTSFTFFLPALEEQVAGAFRCCLSRLCVRHR